jgi:hypothetical protein
MAVGCQSHITPNVGATLIQYLKEKYTPMIGNSNASLKGDQGSQALIISKGKADHIKDPLLSISGIGPVNRQSTDLSSACCKLQAQTTAAIMSNLTRRQ